VLDAFGLDPKVESKGKIRQILTSDLSNPASFANLQRDPKYRELAAAFNFGPDGGVLQPPEAQTDGEELATIQLYNTRVGTSASEEAAAKDENLYYHGAIARVRSLDDFLADKRLVAYALKAYGLEGAGISNSTLRAVLTSDPSTGTATSAALRRSQASRPGCGILHRRCPDQARPTQQASCAAASSTRRTPTCARPWNRRRRAERRRAIGALLPAQAAG
jgi:hypothetical protein